MNKKNVNMAVMLIICGLSPFCFTGCKSDAPIIDAVLEENITDLNTSEATPKPELLTFADELYVTDRPATDIAAEPDNTDITPMSPDILEYVDEYQNPDIIGFLEIENTSISYPVVQSKDNDDYLLVNYNKQPDSAGTIFADYENSVYNTDKNTIIYGHNMKQDIMFHSIRYYKDESFFKEHPFVNYQTLFEDNVYEIFSFYKPNIRFPYTTVNFATEPDFYNIISKMKQLSYYDTGVEIDSTDRVLTLSTCSSGEAEFRLVVSAKLVRQGDLNSRKGITGGKAML